MRKKDRHAAAKIVIDGENVILTVEDITLTFNSYLAKEIGEKLFKAGCALKDRQDRR